MNSVDKKAYVKLGFLIFIALVSVFVFISYKSMDSDKEEVIEDNAPDVINDENETDDIDISNIELNYGDTPDVLDLSDDDLQDYITLKGFDFHAYYEDKYGKKEIEEVIKKTNKLMKNIIQNEKVDKEQFGEMLFEEIQNGDFKRELKIREMNVFLMEPENEEEIILGVSVSYDENKADFFEVTVSVKGGFVVVGLIPEWSNL